MAPAIASDAVIASENSKSLKVLDELFAKLSVSTEAADIEEASNNLASFINGPIEEHAAPTKVVDSIKKLLSNKKDAVARKRALVAVKAIAEHDVYPAVEPYLASLLSTTLAAVGDKMVDVKKAAEAASKAIVQAINPNAVKAVLPALSHSITSAQKWQEKATALECLEILVKTAPSQLAIRLPEVIPTVSEAMWDTKPEIKKAARVTMNNVCSLISNNDINRFIPELIKCIAEPDRVPETVHLLGATTFVQDVHAPTLAIMVPLLERGLADRETAIKRKSAVIVDNMCKLVEDPQIVAPFLPKLMPGLTKNFENIADPEARKVTRRGLDTLIRVGDVKDGKIPEVQSHGDVEVVYKILVDIMSSNHKEAITKYEPILRYIAAIAGSLVDEKEVEALVWIEQIIPFLKAVVAEEPAQAIVQTFRKRASPSIEEHGEDEADDDE
jgi:elongation factor 3